MKITKMILSVVAVYFSICMFTISVSARQTDTEVVSSIVTETQTLTTATVLSAETSSEENLEYGWNNIDDKWFYYDGEELLKGKQQIDGEYYVFADNGALRTGWQTVNSKRCYYDKQTHSQVYGWIEYLGNRYYNDIELGKLTGMREINGNTYIFGDEGILNTGFFMYNDFMYYSDENGVYYGDDKKTPVLINGNYYLISPKGYVLRGWQTVNNKRVYYDYETAEIMHGWINYRDNLYYSDEKKGKYTGEQYISNCIYKFDDSGILQTGLQSFDDGCTRYYYDDGTMATGFIINEDSTYYFNDEGIMQTGWQTIGKYKYYFARDGKMAVGLYDIYGSRYYFTPKGIMLTGFVNTDGTTYYFSSGGRMLYKWQTINNNRYYFGTDGKMHKGFSEINNNTYYFNDEGIMQTGFRIIDGKYYNFGDNGVMTLIKVFVGVGHGGCDPGAIGYIVEKEYTLKTAKVVEQHLNDAGIEYMLSREDDIDTTMESKLKLCLDYDPDLIIDIHFNAVGGHGFEVYHAYSGGMSKTLAENINVEVEKIMYSTGCKIFLRDGVDRFTIIRETNAPAVLLEGGYVDYYEDAMFIAKNYEKLAKAYAEGVLKTIRMMFDG